MRRPLMLSGFLILVVICVVLAELSIFLISRNQPKYYADLGRPPLFWNGFRKMDFLFGHVLWFRYWPSVHGWTRVSCLFLTVATWLLLGAVLVQLWRIMP